MPSSGPARVNTAARLSRACAESSTASASSARSSPGGDVLLPRCLRLGPPGLGEPGRGLASLPVLLGPVGAPDGEDAGDQGQHEEHADPGQRTAQPAPGPAFAGGPDLGRALLRRGQRDGGVEERGLGVVQVAARRGRATPAVRLSRVPR